VKRAEARIWQDQNALVATKERSERRLEREVVKLTVDKVDLEILIKEAATVLERHAVPLCSEHGDIEFAVTQALGILRGAP
jgi:hypothetical protein